MANLILAIWCSYLIVVISVSLLTLLNITNLEVKELGENNANFLKIS